MKRLLTAIFLFFLVCTGQAQSIEQDKTIKLVILPDTQTYTEKYPEIFMSQMEWISNNAENIDFVIHVGDITQNNNSEEWQVAQKGFSLIDGKVPYSIVLGNHDMGSAPGIFADTRNTSLANRYFPLSQFEEKGYFGGAFEEGSIDNLYYTFDAGGIPWLVFSLEFGPRDEVLAWANSVIAKNPDKKVIVSTHAYMYSDDTRMGDGDYWRPQGYGIGKDSLSTVNDGEQIWDKLVKKHPNILFVFSGHVLNDGTGKLVSKGTQGNKVYQMLANYQQGVKGSENGGNGFLRIITSNPKHNSMEVRTYSPWLDEFKTEPDQHFEFTEVGFND